MNYRKRSFVIILVVKSCCLLVVCLVIILVLCGLVFIMKLLSLDIVLVGFMWKKWKMNLCMYWKVYLMFGWMVFFIDYSWVIWLVLKWGMVLYIFLLIILIRLFVCCVLEILNEKIIVFIMLFILNVMFVLVSLIGMMCLIVSWVIMMVYWIGFVLIMGCFKWLWCLISRFVDI